MLIFHHNVEIIDLNHVINDKIGKQILLDLNQYGLLGEKITNTNIKKICYHYLIKEMCDTFIKSTNKCAYYYNISDSNENILSVNFPNDDIGEFIHKLLKRINNILPIIIYIADVPYNELETTEGELIVNNIIQSIYSFNTSKYTFHKAKKFAEINDLTFLSKHFFGSIKSKRLLYK